MREKFRKKKHYARLFYIGAVITVLALVVTFGIVMDVLYSKGLPTTEQTLWLIGNLVLVVISAVCTLSAVNNYSVVCETINRINKSTRIRNENDYLVDDFEKVADETEERRFAAIENYFYGGNKNDR